MFTSLFSLVGPAAILNIMQRFFTPDFAVTLLCRIGVAVLVLVAARIAVALVRRLVTRGISAAVTRSGQPSRRLTTLQGVLISTLSYLIYFVAIILVLFSVGVTPQTLAPLLGAASVLGLAIGFGAQRLVRDVITGLFILGEGQFDVGDWVTIGGVTGRVEDIGLRVTRLRDEMGRTYIIANGDITQVFNASRGLVKLPVEIALQRVAVADGVAAIHAAAQEVLREYGNEPRQEWEQPSVVVVGMEAAKVTVRLVLWVPVSKASSLEDAVRRRILDVTETSETKLALA